MFTTSAENDDEEVVTNLRNVQRSLRDLSNPLDLPESIRKHKNYGKLIFVFAN